MGLSCSSARQGISFHPHCRGSHISFNSCLHQAKRIHSFHDGLVFSNRPLFPKEKIWIKVLEIEPRWHGAIRLGFTSFNPSDIDRNCLPPFACPDLATTHGFWAIAIPEELCREGAELCFWVNRKGEAFYRVRGQIQSKMLFSGIPRRTQLWAMLDVYGQTKAIQLLDLRSKCRDPSCSCHQNKVHHEMGTRYNALSIALDQTSETPRHKDHCMQESKNMDLHSEAMNLHLFREDEPSCVICQDRLADTLLLPCRHCSFCQPCVRQIKRQSNICPLCRQNILGTRNVGEMPLLLSQGS
ncbi:E3 ubiquitin-protein ligase NEURL3 [Mixophyes fleayi]|uniref:E3 ubiquitin-protein ligase NEURL3 n=1 Tax=Mixophyes fleayi TaxID=3061075 RepID=UPI003F4E129E